MPAHKDYEAKTVSRGKPPKPPKKPLTPEEKKQMLGKIKHGLLVASATFGIVLFVFWGASIFKQWIELLIQGRFIAGLEQKVQQIIQAPLTGGPSGQTSTGGSSGQTPSTGQSFFHIIPSGQIGGGEQLVSSSFSDLFSGVAWLNQEKTSLYQDWAATALIFQPNVVWEKATFSNMDGFRFRKDDGSDVLCLSAGCLSQRGNTLTLDNKTIKLPKEIQGKTIENVSIGVLTSRWVVGAVTSENGKYEGWVYSFDPSTALGASGGFTKVFGEANTPFQSIYKGTIGFGGTDDDWLAVYSGYQGIAYRIRSQMPFTDVSHFFDIRVMDGGFQPVITRISVFGRTVWYIWSLSDKHPELIKLYEDGSTKEIVGEVDFTKRIFINSGVSKASFRYAGTQGNAIALQARLEYGSGEVGTYVFSDSGFIVPSPAVVESVNISNYPAEVRTATITEADVYKGGAGVNYYLSNNGNDWVAATLGKEVVFPQLNGRLLFWRAEFISGFDSLWTPPFVDKLRVDYRVKFL